MRYVIYGAGAVGGALGARLFHAGHGVVLIARGAHLEAIRGKGLHFTSPDEDLVLPIPAVSHPREIDFRPDDVAVLAMKTQDTEAALLDLEATAGADIPVFCCQNGVENERMAARRFARVYGMAAYVWGTYLEPGVITGQAPPVASVLPTGRYPIGVDDLVRRVTDDLGRSRVISEPAADIMRLKYAKLLANLSNGIEAITGGTPRDEEFRRIHARLREEALACYRAAGIDHASQAEVDERVSRHRAGVTWFGGGSTWQSLMRGLPALEVDHLNGEVVLLGKLHGMPTPGNALVRRLANGMAARGEKPGRYTLGELSAMIDEAAVTAERKS